MAASLITGEQVKDGSLTGADVKDHSLTKADLAGVTAHASRRGRGRRGRRGPRGFRGPARPSRSAGRCWINKDCLGRWPCRFPVFNRRRWLSGRTLHGDLPGRELCCRWRLQRQHTEQRSRIREERRLHLCGHRDQLLLYQCNPHSPSGLRQWRRCKRLFAADRTGRLPRRDASWNSSEPS